jgi:hypothetical protein
MKSNPLSQLPDDALQSALLALTRRSNENLARLLASLAEMDARELFRSAGYSSAYEFCVHGQHMDEDDVPGYLRVARVARQFPAIFPAIADARLNTATVLLLEPHLTPATVDELLAAAAHKTETEIKRLLAERFLRT